MSSSLAAPSGLCDPSPHRLLGILSVWTRVIPVVISPGYQVGARHWVNHFMCSITFHFHSLPQNNAFPILYVSKTGVQFTELS